MTIVKLLSRSPATRWLASSPSPNPRLLPSLPQETSHERYHGKSATQDRRSRGSPIRRSHHEGRGRIEHWTVRKIPSRVVRLLSHRGTGVGRVLPASWPVTFDYRTEKINHYR